MTQQPIVLGLMLCENMIVEERSRNITLVNCFSQRLFETFPSDPIDVVAFAFLSNGEGQMRFDLLVERLDTLEAIWRTSYAAKISDPLHTVRCAFRVRKISFPVPGHYQFLLLVDSEVIAQRKIRVEATEVKDE